MEVKKEVTDSNGFNTILGNIGKLLEYKNKAYGNAILEPLNIFEGKCITGQRIDEKIARIKHSNELRKNDVVDLIGYLVLTCKDKNWISFNEFMD